MDFTEEGLREARRQIGSTLHKLRETRKTLQAKVGRCKPQITLAERRIRAFEIADFLIGREPQAFASGREEI